MTRIKRESRAAALRRLAAKQGWYDGRDGMPFCVPTRTVTDGTATKTIVKPVSPQEQAAYGRGYWHGVDAQPGEVNPYGQK